MRQLKGYNQPLQAGCHSPNTIQAVQPFPKAGILAKNTNRSLALLTKRLRKVRDRAYSYIVRSIKLDRAKRQFEQLGSAPNFQGEVLTLCTCKHQMRASQSADDWENNVWIAGFTSRTIYEGKHWLFYLAKVEAAHESQSDLWNSTNEHTREAKAAHLHFLGDMFKPKKPNLVGMHRYSPNRYYTPSHHSHRKNHDDTGWYNDIRYLHAQKHGRQSLLLVADPRLTFLWEEPKLFLNQLHCRNYFKWSSLSELLAQLAEAT